MKENLRVRLSPNMWERLARITNPQVHEFIAFFVSLCNPDRVFISTDSEEDLQYIRESAIKNGEEIPLAIPGHTAHFDSYFDQGRDKKNTKILVPPGENLGPFIETMDREKGLSEILELLRDIMKGREMYVLFLCLGPANSPFTIPCVQLTDSSYVAHNEYLLYRPGYEEFIRRGNSFDFFRFVHAQGELDERKTCKNIDKRRIYIDLEGETVYSVNTQYGGNSIGMKKLAMRLAIRRGDRENWLTEHMLIMGVRGSQGRVTYFTGAFPSLCGKTSTAMLEGETIVGDDIAYLRNINGEARAVNVERGMFGIIQGINSVDDPIIYKALCTPGEVIFSNVLITEDGGVFWEGKDAPLPERGINHSGMWFPGKKDEKGREIPPSHPNARFTISLEKLENLDPHLDDPLGVVVSGIVYGGRDSDTWPPVEEAFDWVHGIITKGAALESETTAATLGEVGVRELNPMSNLDFLSIPIGRYIQNNLNFGKGLKRVPKIFSVNYFLKDADGRYLNEKRDKKVWFKWMEKRVHGEVRAAKTPTGFIPLYPDLKALFKEVLQKEYREEDYVKQFMLRVNENLRKIERVTKIYREKVEDTPPILFEVLEEQRKRLLAVLEKYGPYVNPFVFEVV
ncbi:MAG: phosphoenolpyruvate carboxykinase (GTP) [Candidatus Caldatribacterium sp.]|nr:phosphoenolpyruvate carboxykinase (GTP) [Candidatus Caldatribacterium sp.]